jgi:hypothetical protein
MDGTAARNSRSTVMNNALSFLILRFGLISESLYQKEMKKACCMSMASMQEA